MTGVCLISLFFSWKISKYNIIAAFIFFLISLRATFAAYYPYSPISFLGEFKILVLDTAASQSLIFLWSIAIPLLFFKNYKKWMDGFLWLGTFSAFFTFFNLLSGFRTTYGALAPVGIMGNCSMDSMFLAMLVPYATHIRARIRLIFILAAIGSYAYFWHSLTGPIMLGAALAVWLVRNKKWAYFSLFGLLGIASFYFSKSPVNVLLNGRQKMFAQTWAAFKYLGNWVFGNYPGSFITMMPDVEKAYGEKDLYIWAHNEYVQIIFENGFLGLILVLTLYTWMLKRSWKTPWLFSTILGFSLASLTQMPLRLFVTSLFFSTTFFICFEGRDGTIGEGRS